MPTNKFHNALSYASTLHTDQLRKGTDIPYAAYLLGVASLVLYYGGTETQAIAALFHDTIEDCGAKYREPIRTRFDQGVLDIVNACTDAEGGHGTENPKWEIRKRAYIDRLRTEPTSSTTPATSCEPFARSAPTPGNASTAAARTSSGTTGP